MIQRFAVSGAGLFLLTASLFVLASPLTANGQDATSCVRISEFLSFGDTDENSGNQVTLLQRFLENQRNPRGQPYLTMSLGADYGSFHSNTEIALKNFQRDQKIVLSGTPARTGFGATGPRTRDRISAVSRCGTVGVTSVTNSMSIASDSGSATTQGIVPLYLLHRSNGGELITSDESERTRLLSNRQWTDGGRLGYIEQSNLTGTRPLYRIALPTNDHLATIFRSEVDPVVAGNPERYEGTLGRVYTSTSAGDGRVPLYRFVTSNGHGYATTVEHEETPDGSTYILEGTLGYLTRSAAGGNSVNTLTNNAGANTLGNRATLGSRASLGTRLPAGLTTNTLGANNTLGTGLPAGNTFSAGQFSSNTLGTSLPAGNTSISASQSFGSAFGASLPAGGSTISTNQSSVNTFGNTLPSGNTTVSTSQSSFNTSGNTLPAGNTTVSTSQSSDNTLGATLPAGGATYALTVTKSGTGTGSITSNSASVTCNATTCSGNLQSGASVTLTATPSGSSTFGSWSGCTSTSGTNGIVCNITMPSSARAVTATFNAPVATTPTAPATKPVLSLSPSTVNTQQNFQFTWSPANNTPTSYEYAYSLNGGAWGAWTGLGSAATAWPTPSPSTPQSIGLGPASLAVKVRGCNAGGCGPESDPVTLTVTAPAPAAVPPAPTITLPSTSGTKDTSFTASWGVSGAASYILTINGTEYPRTITSWTGTPTDIGITATGGTITLTAKACNTATVTNESVQCSAPSQSATYTVTAPAAPPPAAPQRPTSSINLVSNGGNSYSISWSSSSDATSCRVQYTLNNGPWTDLAGFTGTSGGPTTFTLAPGQYVGRVVCSGNGYTDIPSDNTVSANVAINSLNRASQIAGVLGAVSSISSAPQANTAFSYTWNNDLQIYSQHPEDIAALQTALAREGVYIGEITGGFYMQTYFAVKRFQEKYGIESTGFVGPQTRTKLNELY